MANWPSEFEEILRHHLVPIEGPIDPAASLADLGLDSAGMIRLIMEFEDVLDDAFPDDLLQLETFESAGALWAAVRPLRNWAAVAAGEAP